MLQLHFVHDHFMIIIIISYLWHMWCYINNYSYNNYIYYFLRDFVSLSE